MSPMLLLNTPSGGTAPSRTVYMIQVGNLASAMGCRSRLLTQQMVGPGSVRVKFEIVACIRIVARVKLTRIFRVWKETRQHVDFYFYEVGTVWLGMLQDVRGQYTVVSLAHVQCFTKRLTLR